MDQIREMAAWFATTDFLPWPLNRLTRWCGCKMLGYSNRNSEIIVSQERLRNKYPIAKCLEAWLSGEGVLTEHEEGLLKAGTIKELIVPDPDSPYLSVLQESFGAKRDAYDFAGQIRRMTKLAIRYQIPVKWFRGVPGMSVTVGNPSQPNAWAHLDLIWPGIDPNKRIIVRLEGNHDGDLIGQYRNAINAMFHNVKITFDPDQERL